MHHRGLNPRRGFVGDEGVQVPLGGWETQDVSTINYISQRSQTEPNGEWLILEPSPEWIYAA